MEGNDCGPTAGTILRFPWSNWGNPWKTQDIIVSKMRFELGFSSTQTKTTASRADLPSKNNEED
jgi:hypothetical protein